MEDSDIPDFRRAVRAHLAERPSVAQSAVTVHRHVGREFPVTLQETTAALDVLVTFGHLKSTKDPLGGRLIYYQATADGILAHERGE